MVVLGWPVAGRQVFKVVASSWELRQVMFGTSDLGSAILEHPVGLGFLKGFFIIVELQYSVHVCHIAK